MPEDLMSEPESTRGRILLAAISLLERGGPGAMTVRRIASEAGVNTAAVNYHFGSKASLMKIVMDTTLEHVFEDWTAVMTSKEPGLHARLHCFLELLMEGIERYPGMVRARLFDPDLKQDSRSMFTQRFGDFLNTLQELLAEESPMEPRDLRLSLAQMIASAMTMALIPELLEESTGHRGSHRKARDLFITGLIRRFAGFEPVISRTDRKAMERLFSMAFSGSGLEASTKP